MHSSEAILAVDLSFSQNAFQMVFVIVGISPVLTLLQSKSELTVCSASRFAGTSKCACKQGLKQSCWENGKSLYLT